MNTNTSTMSALVDEFEPLFAQLELLKNKISQYANAGDRLNYASESIEALSTEFRNAKIGTDIILNGINDNKERLCTAIDSINAFNNTMENAIRSIENTDISNALKKFQDLLSFEMEKFLYQNKLLVEENKKQLENLQKLVLGLLQLKDDMLDSLSNASDCIFKKIDSIDQLVRSNIETTASLSNRQSEIDIRMTTFVSSIDKQLNLITENIASQGKRLDSIKKIKWF